MMDRVEANDRIIQLESALNARSVVAMSQKQTDLLTFVYAFMVENLRSPTFEEVASGLGIGKPSAYDRYLNLRRQGVFYAHQRHRGMRLTPKGLAHLDLLTRLHSRQGATTDSDYP